MISQCEVICNALHLIDEEGWIQGAEHSSKGWCLTGACSEAVKRKIVPGKERDLMLDIVRMHVTAALPAEWKGTGIVGFNDSTGRQKYEIQTVLKTAGACNHDGH
jgi:hypothetical protein